MGKNFVGHRRRWGYGYKDAEVKVCVEKESKICSAKVRLGAALWIVCLETRVLEDGVCESPARPQPAAAS